MLLSILIPGKNDDYFNAFKRLTLNLRKTISNLNISYCTDVEIALCDWGSETKIIDELDIELSDNIKCVYVPREIAQKYNRDVKYSIVHPINTAFRHSKGKYVIFWDSDCYVSQDDFMKLYNFVKEMDKKNDMAFYWGSRYHIPYEQHNEIEDIQLLDEYVKKLKLSDIKHDKININDFGGCAISLLMNRRLWEESTGWWEDLIYWGWQDIEFHRRLSQRYTFGGDLEDKNIKFFHLDHHQLTDNENKKTNDHKSSPKFNVNGNVWGLNNETVHLLEAKNKINKVDIIKRIIDVVYKSKEGHIASSLSILDILICLYNNVLTKTDTYDRNRFILSKGHASIGLYAVLEYFKLLEDDLDTFCQFDSSLGGHPNDKIHGVETSSGSLGHGLPIAIGMAMGHKIQKFNKRIYVIIGDGELNEGSIWESLLLGANHNLNNLTCILDYNHSGDRALKLDDIKNKIHAFNWNCIEIDGHNTSEINKSLHTFHDTKPTLIIAHTIKGKGVSIMENNPEWHHKFPNDTEYQQIIKNINDPPMQKSLIITTREYGFFSNVFQILDNIKYCELHNIKPIIELGSKFLYKTDDNNKWNNFFDDINDNILEGTRLDYSDVPHKDKFLMSDFILVDPKNNNFKVKVWDEHCKNITGTFEHRREINTFIKKYLTPAKHIQQEIDNFISTHFTTSVLGVHVRGTDYAFHDIDQYIRQIRLMIDKHGYTKIFVASDNEEAIKKISSIFENVCWYHTELRAKNINDTKPVCHIVSGEDNIKHGQDVLIEAYLLGKCDRLICINSNVAAMATYLNPTMDIDLLCRQPDGG